MSPINPVLTDSNGNYAYWIGDEGGKASVYVPSDSAQLQGNGDPLRPYLRYLVNIQFAPDNPRVQDIMSYNPIGLVQNGFSTGQAFHGLTVRHLALTSTIERGAGPSTSAYVSGLMSLNHLNAATWRAILMAIQGASPYQPVLNFRSRDLALSREIVAILRSRGTPFISVNEFQSANVIQQALLSVGLTNVEDPTETDTLDLIGPVLATRSDTFRIRAYGNAINPADAAVAGATPDAVAYCEAIVQRTNEDDPLGNGKKFVITYFRWLGPDDI